MKKSGWGGGGGQGDGVVENIYGQICSHCCLSNDNNWGNSRLTKETWEERLGNEILWGKRALGKL